jgi:3-oxoacyl-[acyl-carrier protein] reductase
MTKLQNKVALITGSARGLGKAIDERYAWLGADIVVNYSKDEKNALETVASVEKLGASAIAVQGDISRVPDIKQLFAASLNRFGKIDIVVANAGVELADQPIIDFTEEATRPLVRHKYKGAFFLG